jgi:hypothetical protein
MAEKKKLKVEQRSNNGNGPPATSPDVIFF